MRSTIRSLTVGVVTIALLTACGPAPNGPATTVVSSSESSPVSADTTPGPAATVSQAVVPVRSTTVPAVPKAKLAATGTALAAVARLTVKGRARKTGYTSAQFGQAWYDTDLNGCDTRNDILRRDPVSRQMKNACKIMAGTLAPDPYTGTSIRFVYGGASEVDIDHVVALSDSWQFRLWQRAPQRMCGRFDFGGLRLAHRVAQV